MARGKATSKVKPTTTKGKSKSPQEAVPIGDGPVDAFEPETGSQSQAEGANSDPEVRPAEPGTFEYMFGQLPKTYSEMRPDDFLSKMPLIYELLADNNSNPEIQQWMKDRLVKWGLKSSIVNTRIKQILGARVTAEQARLKAAEDEAAKLKAEEDEALHALDDRTPPEGWEFQAELERNPKTGAYVSSVHNALEVFAHDPRWAGVLAFDDFLGDNVFLKEPPWTESARSPVPFRPSQVLVEADYTRVVAWFRRNYAMSYQVSQAFPIVDTAALTHPCDSLRDYYKALTWDRVDRLKNVASYLKCEDTHYNRSVFRMWMISKAARADVPGCQVDTMLILIGKQDDTKFKTTFYKDIRPSGNGTWGIWGTWGTRTVRIFSKVIALST